MHGGETSQLVMEPGNAERPARSTYKLKEKVKYGSPRGAADQMHNLDRYSGTDMQTYTYGLPIRYTPNQCKSS